MQAAPPRREPHDLPALPDWPPLPNEPSRADWSSLGASAPDESRFLDVPSLPPEQSGEPLWPESPQPAAVRTGQGDILGRFRSTSTRTRFGVAAGIVCVFVILIAACSSLALHAASGVVSNSSPTSAAAAAQASRPSRTPSPLPTETPHATSPVMPTAAPPQQPLTLAFTCASGRLRGTGQVCVHTQPQAMLSIAVRYCDGSTARDLHGSATADASGNYTWTWPVRASTCTGPATATVTVTWKGQSLTQSDTFTIST